jgi:cation/acetate symporter
MTPGQDLWFGIQPLSAAVFGVPIGFIVAGVVSLLTRPGESRQPVEAT